MNVNEWSSGVIFYEATKKDKKPSKKGRKDEMNGGRERV